MKYFEIVSVSSLLLMGVGVILASLDNDERD